VNNDVTRDDRWQTRFFSIWGGQALSLLDVASAIYPENGSLEDTRADILREKSKRSYQKALDLDPTLQDTWENLKEIE